MEETLVLEFTHELQQQEPEEFAQGVLRRIGTEVVVAETTSASGTGGGATSHSSRSTASPWSACRR